MNRTSADMVVTNDGKTVSEQIATLNESTSSLGTQIESKQDKLSNANTLEKVTQSGNESSFDLSQITKNSNQIGNLSKYNYQAGNTNESIQAASDYLESNKKVDTYNEIGESTVQDLELPADNITINNTLMINYVNELTIKGKHTKLIGATPTTDIMNINQGEGIYVENLCFVNGKNQLALNTQNISSSRVMVNKCTFDGGATSILMDNVKSAIGEITNNRFISTEYAIKPDEYTNSNTPDVLNIKNNWFINKPWTGDHAFIQVSSDFCVNIEDNLFNPEGDPRTYTNQRWIDNYKAKQLNIRGNRFGGEVGGMPLLNNYYNNATIVIEDNYFSWQNASHLVQLNTLPKKIVFRNNAYDTYNFPNQLISIPGSTLMDTYYAGNSFDLTIDDGTFKYFPLATSDQYHYEQLFNFLSHSQKMGIAHSYATNRASLNKEWQMDAVTMTSGIVNVGIKTDDNVFTGKKYARFTKSNAGESSIIIGDITPYITWRGFYTLVVYVKHYIDSGGGGNINVKSNICPNAYHRTNRSGANVWHAYAFPFYYIPQTFTGTENVKNVKITLDPDSRWSSELDFGPIQLYAGLNPYLKDMTTNTTKTGSSAPTVSADFIGQQYVDTTNKIVYTAVSVGTGSGDWKQTSN